jgi:hypothetical protein
MVKCGVLFEVRTEFLNNIYNGRGVSWTPRSVKHRQSVSLTQQSD